MDPGFQNPDAWTVSPRGGAILPDERFTPTDDGIAFFAPSVACNAGVVSQMVEMPSYEVAEAFAAEVTYKAQGLLGWSLGFNRAWTQLRETSDDLWRTERVCLGEAAYGGPVLVQTGSTEQHPSCFDEPQGDIQVDHVAIVVADPGECPAPGEVLNGDAEEDQGSQCDATSTGWRCETTSTAEAGLVEGAGRGGTAGIRIAREGSARAAAWTKLSVPSSESLPSPALRFWWKGTSGAPFRFEIGRFEGVGQGAFPLDTAIGSGSDENFVYCLPPWTHGNVVDLIFKFALGTSTELNELVIDDVEIVSDESCGATTDLLDPGFEAGPNEIMGVTIFDPFEATATLRTEPSLARTGEGALELSYFSESAVMWFETWVFVPESNGDEGPAAFFWSNVPSANEKEIKSVLGRAAVDPRDLQPGGGWRRNRVCLFPEWSGRWFRLQLRLGDFATAGTAPVDPPIRIYIDDFELTTDDGCRSD
jgi:hypothetical protein